MGYIQVKLNQVLSEFKECLHSVDVRAAVSKSDSGWQSVLMGIRVSTRSVEEVQNRHLKLEKQFGKRRIEQVGILLQASPFSELEGIMRALNQGMIEIEREKVVFPRKLLKVVSGVSHNVERSPLDELTGRVERYREFLQPWEDDIEWPGIYFSTGEKSPVFSQLDITRAIRAKLGASSVEELVSNFFEFKEFRHSLDVFIHIDMPAKILEVKSIGQTIEVELTTENHLRNFHLFMKREDHQGRPQQHQELRLELVRSDDRFSIWNAKGDLDSANKDDVIFCTLTHENGFELDEKNGRIWQFMPVPEVNPLLECVKQFRDMNILAQQIERPYETAKKKQQEGPQDMFQESITFLLSLAGFQAIDLGRDDKLRHPDSEVDRATLDILAYHKDSNILLLGACIITTPRNEDFDKLLHAKAILSRRFSAHSNIRIVTVLFSGQENEVESQGEVKILTSGKLAILRRLIENGEEERFIRFLEDWPGGRGLGE